MSSYLVLALAYHYNELLW